MVMMMMTMTPLVVVTVVIPVVMVPVMPVFVVIVGFCARHPEQGGRKQGEGKGQCFHTNVRREKDSACSPWQLPNIFSEMGRLSG